MARFTLRRQILPCQEGAVCSALWWEGRLCYPVVPLSTMTKTCEILMAEEHEYHALSQIVFSGLADSLQITFQPLRGKPETHPLFFLMLNCHECCWFVTAIAR